MISSDNLFVLELDVSSCWCLLQSNTNKSIALKVFFFSSFVVVIVHINRPNKDDEEENCQRERIYLSIQYNTTRGSMLIESWWWWPILHIHEFKSLTLQYDARLCAYECTQCIRQRINKRVITRNNKIRLHQQK